MKSQKYQFKSTAKHIVPCPYCGKDALDHMTVCPSCSGELKPKGYVPASPGKYKFVKRGVGAMFWIAAAVIVLLIIISYMQN